VPTCAALSEFLDFGPSGFFARSEETVAGAYAWMSLTLVAAHQG